MILEIQNVKFNILRNALYHTARRRYFERLNRIFNFTIILLGTASITSAIGNYGITPQYIGILVATVGAMQLVWDFGRQARDHQSLQKSYYSLLSDMDKITSHTEETLCTFNSEMIKITADEPPTLRAIDAKAYNDAIGASGYYDNSERLHIPFHHSLLGNFLSFEGYDYKKKNEISENRG